MDYVARAKEIAFQAHRGQFRWDHVTPYIVHPAAVAIAVSQLGPDYEAAGWLHDVLEDTEWDDFSGIPSHVLAAVQLLTKGDGPYIEYLLGIMKDPIAVQVKLADIEHNLSTSDPKKNRTIRDKWLMARYILEKHHAEGYGEGNHRAGPVRDAYQNAQG